MPLVKKILKGIIICKKFFDNYFLMKQRIKIETENKIIKLKIINNYLFFI